MTYRRLTVGGETFEVRISDHGFREWLADRERLADQPDPPPDRPPDVDDETMRAWVPHPGEEGLAYFHTHPFVPADLRRGASFPVVSYKWKSSLDGSQAWFVILGDPDGSFQIQVVADMTTVMFNRVYPKEMGPDAVWADIEEQIERFSKSVTEYVVRVTTYADYEAFDAELDMVWADIEQRGFINPLPEGPVQ
jgi:hypothetical protein